jgi:hypothetical protein
MGYVPRTIYHIYTIVVSIVYYPTRAVVNIAWMGKDLCLDARLASKIPLPIELIYTYLQFSPHKGEQDVKERIFSKNSKPTKKRS